MSKKVLILSGSPRKGGNSDILCDEFLRGAQDAGHKAEKIRVAEKKVGIPVPAATTAAPTAEPASTRMIWQTSCKR